MKALLATLGIAVSLSPTTAKGFGFFDGTGATGLNGGSRWDTTPRTLGGFERSLSGGLRFSLQGGSYQAYRDLFTWQGSPPSVASFQQAVLDAFNAWTITDPATGLGSLLNFVPDLATPVSTALSGGVRAGAEIDLFGSIDGSTWNPGDSGTRGEAIFNSVSVSGNLRLTSGTINYPGFAISGSDITFNTNPQAVYNLTSFRVILTHEIGHALGLADVDFVSGPNGTFVDDNYDPTSAATAFSTLTNSFSLLINQQNPSLSPLDLYVVANGSPGLDSAGVDILMESSIPSSLFAAGNPLRADDFAGRQFLYPIPEPSAAMLACAAVSVAGLKRRRN
jgi:hypothetical protein